MSVFHLASIEKEKSRTCFHWLFFISDNIRSIKQLPSTLGLVAVWEIVFRLLVTEVYYCNVADVLFISEIYNVQQELKFNSITKVDGEFRLPKLQ